MQWRDVDLDRGIVRVERALYRGMLDEPKSRYGKRSVPLTPRLRESLQAIHGELGCPSGNAPVFQSGDGMMLDPANIRSRVMRPAAAAAGLSWATPHTLRHTFASRCF